MKKYIDIVETKFELINLKLQASKIRNCQKLQERLDALTAFVSEKKVIDF